MSGLRFRERTQNAHAFVWLDVPSQDHAQLGPARPDFRGPCFHGPQLHLDAVEEVSYRFRRGPVTVAELVAQPSEVVQDGELRDAPVELELPLAAADEGEAAVG